MTTNLSDEEIWISFAANYGASGCCPDVAAQHADTLLLEFKVRFRKPMVEAAPKERDYFRRDYV